MGGQKDRVRASAVSTSSSTALLVMGKFLLRPGLVSQETDLTSPQIACSGGRQGLCGDEAQMQMLSGSGRDWVCSEPNNSFRDAGIANCDRCSCRCWAEGVADLTSQQDAARVRVKFGSGDRCPREVQSRVPVAVSFTRERRRWRFCVTCSCVLSPAQIFR
jgi:hypothetical protein